MAQDWNEAKNATSGLHPLNAIAPKSALKVLLALALLSIGFGLAKLLNRCYRRVHLQDNRSDVSDHTRHLLRLQKSTRRGLLPRRGRSSNQMSEEERLQWQMTVLSMWQRRPEEEDEADMDPHTVMLSRLRNAWLSRHHRGGRDPAAQANGARRRTAEELQAEVKRVALAWLAASRAAAAVTRRNRRRLASHYAMMRRLSRAWRQHMGTISEAATTSGTGDSDNESYTTVADEFAGDAAANGAADLESASVHRDSSGGYSCRLL